MRESKYRVWDNKRNEYISGGLRLFGNVIECGSHQVIEQYTGIEDMNGVGIFEGDILRCESKDSGNLLVGVVEYDAPFYRIDGNELFWNAEEFEVVGNAHTQETV